MTTPIKRRSKNQFRVTVNNKAVVRETIKEMKVIKGFLKSPKYTPNRWKVEETINRLAICELILKLFYRERHCQIEYIHVFDKRKPV